MHLAPVVGRPPEQREVVAQRLGRGSPRSRKSSIATAPWRFESLARSGRRSAGGARTRAVGARRAPSRSASTRWVESRRSSPRITWVMPISRSSTALARKKIGLPSERTITKSEIVDHSTRTSPRTRSTKLLTPVVGGAEPHRRAAGPRPRSARALGRRSGRGSGRRSPGGRPAARAASLRAFDLLRRCRSTRTRARRRAAGRPRRGTRSKRALWRTGPSSQSRPSQRSVVLDADDPLVARPGEVGVLDAQDERAAVVAGEEPVEQRGAAPTRRAASRSAPARTAHADAARTYVESRALGASTEPATSSSSRRAITTRWIWFVPS